MSACLLRYGDVGQVDEAGRLEAVEDRFGYFLLLGLVAMEELREVDQLCPLSSAPSVAAVCERPVHLPDTYRDEEPVSLHSCLLHFCSHVLYLLETSCATSVKMSR